MKTTRKLETDGKNEETNDTETTITSQSSQKGDDVTMAANTPKDGDFDKEGNGEEEEKSKDVETEDVAEEKKQPVAIIAKRVDSKPADASVLPPPPVLKGTLSYDLELRRHLIRGMWNYENSNLFPNQRFEYVRDLEPDENPKELPKDGEFHGFFSIAYFHPKSERSKVIQEYGVNIKFTRIEGDTEGTLKIDGKGTNQFGSFHINGTAEPSPHDDDQFIIVLRKQYEPSTPSSLGAIEGDDGKKTEMPCPHSSVNDKTQAMSEPMHHRHERIVLFYKYFLPPLKRPTKVEIEELHQFLQVKCTESSIKGRILLATEGINGTLSGRNEDCLKDFCRILEDAQSLLKGIDWKFSDNKARIEPFPDLKIAVVREIVSTGNTVSLDDIPEYGGKHLTPREFHEALEDTNDKETVIVDVRNTFEYNIGHFVPPQNSKKEIAVLNPEMVTFSSFNKFCDQNVDYLKDKKVLMYCTGGIRCEKASAMLQKRGVPDVYQLEGGIHRYVEKFGANGFFKGKNFVFDQRVAIDASGSNKQIVGRCINCSSAYDELSGSRVCTVCRDLVLVCETCQRLLPEYHCQLHSTWRASYFTFLDRFDTSELRNQMSGLEMILGQTSSRNTKRTIRKQITKVQQRISALESGSVQVDRNAPNRCRTCREPQNICDGLCWGFWKRENETQREIDKDRLTIEVGQSVEPGPDWNEVRLGARDQYGIGKVVQVKSWAGGEQDCVAVLWDSESRLEGGDESKKEYNPPKIYRFGVMAKDSRRKYDVVPLEPKEYNS
eukprot:scaffold6265_cov193-Cylindrotheca_fusiformis.AAC.3